MLLHELLVILSGYASSLDPKEFKHPVERQIFERALEFSELVAQISASLVQQVGPVTDIVQGVITLYFKVILELESRLADLSYSKIIAETVDEWQRPLEYCKEMLMAQKYVGVKMVVKLRKDVFSGFPQIAKIASQSLEAVDRYYIRQISPWLLWGNLPTIDLEYPEMEEVSVLVKSIGNFLRNVGFVQADSEFIEVTRASHAALARVEYPLIERQICTVLGEIQASINTKMLPHVLAQSKVDQLMVILRNIVLCGSPLFCICFVETSASENWLSTAISQYYENTGEIDAETYQTALESLFLVDSGEAPHPWTFGDVLTGEPKEAELRLDSRFPIFINSTHCHVYGEIFYYLLSLWAVNDSLAGFSPGIQHHKLVLNAIWEWFRRSIDATLADLEKLFSGEPASLDTILEAHTAILRQLGKKLLMGSRQSSTSIKRILKNAQLLAAANDSELMGDNGDPISDLKQALAGQVGFSDLYSQLEMVGPI